MQQYNKLSGPCELQKMFANPLSGLLAFACVEIEFVTSVPELMNNDSNFDVHCHHRHKCGYSVRHLVPKLNELRRMNTGKKGPNYLTIHQMTRSETSGRAITYLNSSKLEQQDIILITNPHH